MLGVPYGHVHHHGDDLKPGVSLNTADTGNTQYNMLCVGEAVVAASPGGPSLKGVGPLEGGEGAQLALSSLRSFHQPTHQPQVLHEGHRHFIHSTARVVHQVQEVGAAYLQLPARGHSLTHCALLYTALHLYQAGGRPYT